MDALCHAVEAYTNGTYNTRVEKDMAKQAVRLVFESLYEAYRDGSNMKARKDMQHAAFYAGWPKAWAAFKMAKNVWNDEE